jgi:preprotein translocase subunit YajC
MLFSTQAFAQTAPATGVAQTPGAGLASMIPLVLIFVVFYFLIIRPQQKKMKEHQAMVANLRRGDKVITAGGIIGVVSKVVDDTEVVVDIADSVQVRVVRTTITSVLSKPEPANDRKAA